VLTVLVFVVVSFLCERKIPRQTDTSMVPSLSECPLLRIMSSSGVRESEWEHRSDTAIVDFARKPFAQFTASPQGSQRKRLGNAACRTPSLLSWPRKYAVESSFRSTTGSVIRSPVQRLA
jgi:hypothetical protein